MSAIAERPKEEVLPATIGRLLPPIAQERRPSPDPTYPKLPKLSEALAAARDRCTAAAKDAENTFHHYRYASAEAVLGAAVEAMRGSGLALLPVREELSAIGSQFVLYRLLLLSHSSGESIPLEVLGWPVVPDRGRPLDKAYASALTTSLAYKVRDLLQMPRAEEGDDIAARDDTHQEPAPAQEPKRSVYDRITDFEGKLVNNKPPLCAAGELVKHLRDTLGSKYGRDSTAWGETAWPAVKEAAVAYRAAREGARLITPEELRDLEAELGRTGEVPSRVAAMLTGQEKGLCMADLSLAQWRTTMDRLRGLPDANP